MGALVVGPLVPVLDWPAHCDIALAALTLPPMTATNKTLLGISVVVLLIEVLGDFPIGRMFGDSLDAGMSIYAPAILAAITFLALCVVAGMSARKTRNS